MKINNNRNNNKLKSNINIFSNVHKKLFLSVDYINPFNNTKVFNEFTEEEIFEMALGNEHNNELK
jgi:glycerol-3-phosphate responsive antiterminator